MSWIDQILDTYKFEIGVASLAALGALIRWAISLPLPKKGFRK
jgi:hypothetical protein